MIRVRHIEARDNASIAEIVRTVMPEFGACGEGYSIQDAEVDDMHSAYSAARSIYFVIENEGVVVGGAGIAPLEGGDANTCELKKMYFLKEARGLGAGQKLIELCLEHAVKFGFKICYLETLQSMTQAKALYLRNGFEPLSAPMGKTGHFGCDSWFSKKL